MFVTMVLCSTVFVLVLYRHLEKTCWAQTNEPMTSEKRELGTLVIHSTSIAEDAASDCIPLLVNNALNARLWCLNYHFL